MKKTLLFASLLMSCGLSALAEPAYVITTDGQTYDEIDGMKIENLWVFDRQHVESDYTISKICNTSARTAATDGKYVYVAVSGDQAEIYKYKMDTGHCEGLLTLTKDGEAFGGTLCCNQIGFDEYDHMYIATYSANSDGSGQYNVYTVDKKTGAVASVGDLFFDGGIGRVDFCDVIGDITGAQANCTIMAMSDAQDNMNVFQWVRKKGSDSFEGGWTDGATFQAIKAGDTYPNSVVGFSYGSVVKMVRDGSKSGDMSMFYIDGFTSLPALYGSDGAMIDNIGAADLIVKDKETKEVISGTLPEPAAGTNGIAEAKVGDQNLMVYSEGQYDAPHCCQAIVTAVNSDMEFSSMKYLWTVPADGLGQTSDSGTRQHCLTSVPQEDGSMLLLTFKCFNGMGVYKITGGEGSVAKTLANAANITVNGDVIAVSETAQSIEVYNLAGQKVAEAHNATEVAAPAQGVYVVKAVVAGAPVVKKVIL